MARAKARKGKGLIAKAVARHLRRNRVTHRARTSANTAKAHKPQPKTLKEIHAQDDDLLKKVGKALQVIDKTAEPPKPKPQPQPAAEMKPIVVESTGKTNVLKIRKHRAPAGQTYVMDAGRTFVLRDGEQPRVENVPPDIASAAGFAGESMVIDGWECLVFKTALTPHVRYAVLMPR